MALGKTALRRLQVQPLRFGERLTAFAFGFDMHARDDRLPPPGRPEIVRQEVATKRPVLAENEAGRVIFLGQPRIVKRTQVPQVVVGVDDCSGQGGHRCPDNF